MKTLTRTGFGIWLSLLVSVWLVNQSWLLLNQSWLPINYHIDAEEFRLTLIDARFDLLMYSALATLVILPICIYEIARQKRLAIIGIVFTLSSFPICWALLNRLHI